MSNDKRASYALACAASVGAGAGVAYYLYKLSVADEISIDLEVVLDKDHVTWLKNMAAKHTNGDRTRALYLLLEHCRVASKDKATADVIFKKVRCNTCEKKEKVMYLAKLTPDQKCFIDSAVKNYKIDAGTDKAFRVMLEYAISDAEETAVFSR